MTEINEIKSKLDIVDVIGNYIELKKAGRNYKGRCPFHAENDPSFMVSQELQIYKCFGCGESGDIFEFIKKIEGIEFIDALKLLAEKAGVKLKKTNFDPNAKEKNLIYELNEITTKFYQKLLYNKVGTRGLKYLHENRKLDDETIKNFRIGFIPNTFDLLYKYLKSKNYTDTQLLGAGLIIKTKRGNYIDKFRGRVMFPLISINNRIVGFTGRDIYGYEPKYLNSPETKVFYKSSYIYGLSHAKVDIKKKGAIIVEGQMDVITAHKNGFKNVIATTGTSLTTNQLKILKRYTNKIIFCFDTDSAGFAATERAITLAENENFNISICNLGEDIKDIDELINKDIQLAKNIINNPIPIYDFYLIKALKEFDETTSEGKKNIVRYMSQKLPDDPITKDHYIKVISDKLGLNSEITKELIINKNTPNKPKIIEHNIKKEASNQNFSTQEYMLTLLFKCENLDLLQNILYKLGKNDFSIHELEKLFTSFKEYASKRKRKVNLKFFESRLDSKLKDIFHTLYLRDVNILVDDFKAYEKELNTTFKRIKKEKIERELKRLNKSIKDAEFEKNDKEVLALSEKVYKLSKLKRRYE